MDPREYPHIPYISTTRIIGLHFAADSRYFYGELRKTILFLQ